MSNVVFTDDGVKEIIEHLDGTGGDSIEYGNLGMGTTTAEWGNTVLYDEASASRQPVTKTLGDKEMKLVTEFTYPTLSGSTVEEGGLFGSTTAGTMFVRWDHASINKNTSSNYEYTLHLRFIN
jgi:hypothetical protein